MCAGELIIVKSFIIYVKPYGIIHISQWAYYMFREPSGFCWTFWIRRDFRLNDLNTLNTYVFRVQTWNPGQKYVSVVRTSTALVSLSLSQTRYENWIGENEKRNNFPVNRGECNSLVGQNTWNAVFVQFESNDKSFLSLKRRAPNSIIIDKMYNRPKT